MHGRRVVSGVDEVILVCFFLEMCELRLLGGGDPEGVGVEEEEEDHAEHHEIHVDEEEDAAVVETPAPLHAADGVCGAGGGGEGGEDEDWTAADLREAGEEDCCEQTDQDKEDAAEEGSLARIEKAGGHAVLINLT
jgi:hypothetical protein